MANKATKNIAGFILAVMDKKINVYASSTAFFLFMALPPFIILMSLLLPRFGLSVNQLVQMATEVTPDDIDGQITWIIQDTYSRASGVLPITLIFIIWAAANSMAALSNGLRTAYGVETESKYIVLRLLAIVYTFLVVALLACYMTLLTIGGKIFEWLGLSKIKLPEFLVVLLNWRHLFFLLIGFTLVLIMYIFLSGKRFSIGYHVFGSIFTVIAWEVSSLGFSAYMKYSTNRNLVYGSFSTIMALLLWMYISISIVLAGGALNEFLHSKDR